MAAGVRFVRLKSGRTATSCRQKKISVKEIQESGMKQHFICAESNIGKIRKRNEDTFFCYGMERSQDAETNTFCSGSFTGENLYIAAVFDGMGGLCRGDFASAAARQWLELYVAEVNEKGTQFDGSYSINEMNRVICQKMDDASETMGSTAVILEYLCGRARVYNVGDSRAYLYRDNSLIQISEDHTEENSMRKMGEILGISFPNSCLPGKNVLTQHLGIPEEEFLLEPAVSEWISVQEKDIFLLCSDGLTGMIQDDQIREILQSDMDLQAKKDTLIETALNNGGKDNVTVVLLEI